MVLGCLFVTFLAAGLLVFAQLKANQKGSEFTTIQARQLREANDRAGEANERAAKLELKAEELRKQNLAFEASIAKEKAALLALEADLAPRSIGDQLIFGKELAAHKNITMIVVAVPEVESRRLAAAIRFVAGLGNTWKQVYVPPQESVEMDGVTVFARNRNEHDDAEKAAEALVVLLKSHGIDANYSRVRGIPARTLGLDLPVNTIRVEVGMKPDRELSKRRQEILRKRGQVQ